MLVAIRRNSRYFLKKYNLRWVRNNNTECFTARQPRHLICFKQWTSQMVIDVVSSALNLKARHQDTHQVKLDTLKNCKIMVLQEVNQPILNMAVSKAASMLGADDVTIVDKVVWEHDYHGRIFSYMADCIFISTSTHMCVQRFSEQSQVPVMCMKSRTHATIQSLSTVMAIIEEFGCMDKLNIAYLGPAHPILNSYLLLSPMLGANIAFKCSCELSPVSPLLFKASEAFTKKAHTRTRACTKIEDLLDQACVVISGPTPRKEKLDVFTITVDNIEKSSSVGWIYFHSCPRGKEVGDDLFHHHRSRTYKAFYNMQYITAALMTYGILNHTFKY